VLTFFLNACTALPLATPQVTGRIRMIDMSRSSELALGEVAYRQLLAGAAVAPAGDAAAARVVRVGRRLAAAAVAEYPRLAADMDWRFALVRAPGDANAVCCPGGRVAIFSGLLSVARDDDALAAVIAHEIAHALARHRCVCFCDCGVSRGLFSLCLVDGLGLTVLCVLLA
jgi:metalloendopeptidase OMA1, mitochondrial